MSKKMLWDETSFPHLTETIFNQILAIRNSGKSNMFDIKTVEFIAYYEGYYELVDFMAGYPSEYANFILHGKRRD